MDGVRRWFTLGLTALVVTVGTAVSVVGMARAQNTPDSSDAEGGGESQRIPEGVVGIVMDSSGAPVADAMVQAVPVGGNATPVPEIAIMSNARGEYAWPLPEGDYQLKVFYNSKASSPKNVTVSSGTTTKLDFFLGD